MQLSESEEEYLESLYKLSRGKGGVRIRELAEDLDVKDPSVVEMFKKLEEKDLIVYERHFACSLTEGGGDRNASFAAS